MKKLKYYFDILSPYSYLSWCWVRDNRQYLSDLDIELELKPIPMSSLIKSFETKGPAEIKPKREYLFRECLRIAAINEIPFNTPKELPFNSLYALRLSLSEISGEKSFDVVDLLFRFAWEHSGDIGNSDELVIMLNDAGFPGEKWLEATGSREIRQKLKENLKGALRDECFGVPSFIYDEELFWGRESIQFLKLKLEEKDPLNISENKKQYKIFLDKF